MPTFILSIAILRSSGVKNQALVGESGKKNLSRVLLWSAVLTIQRKVIPKANSESQCHKTCDNHKPFQWSIKDRSSGPAALASHHCQGRRALCLIWRTEKLRNPDIIWAKTQIKHTMSIKRWAGQTASIHQDSPEISKCRLNLIIETHTNILHVGFVHCECKTWTLRPGILPWWIPHTTPLWTVLWRYSELWNHSQDWGHNTSK